MSGVTRGDSGWSNAREDVVEIVPWDPSWPDQFEAEAKRVLAVIPPGLKCSIEHFGSTAVPKIAAKPIIDIMIICSARDAWGELRAPIESLDYVYWAENPDPDHMFFAKGMPPFGARRTHHVHVRSPDEARRHIIFRDALRASPDLVRQYAELKKLLAAQCRHDRDAYTEGKSAFVNDAVSIAERRGR